jgi:hypothetical protein
MNRKIIPIYLSLLLGTIWIQCGAISGSEKAGEPKALRIIIKFPIPAEKNGTRQDIDSFFVFFYKDYIAYKMPYLHTTNYIEIDKSGNQIGEKTVTEIRYRYFGYAKTSNLGIRYDSVNASTGATIPVDSFASAYGVATIAPPENFRDNYVLAGTIRSDHGFIQQFARKPGLSPLQYCDSIYLHFSSGFDDLPFSLSGRLDTVDRKKLIKVQYLFNPQYDKVRAVTVPKREVSVEMQQFDAGSMHEDIKEIFKKLEAGKM